MWKQANLESALATQQTNTRSYLYNAYESHPKQQLGTRVHLAVHIQLGGVHASKPNVTTDMEYGEEHYLSKTEVKKQYDMLIKSLPY